MARKCFMCGREVTQGGILCEKCDKPRRKAAAPAAETPAAEPSAPPAPAPSSSTPPMPSASVSAAVSARRTGDSGRHAVAQMPVPETLPDPFPKAPVLPFPIESASPAVTSVVHLLVASGVPSVLVGPDRSLKFVSDEARRMFEPVELGNLSALESAASIRVSDFSVPTTAGVRVNGRNYIYTLVPMSGGASGAVLIFRAADPMNEAHASFVTYVRETILGPLSGLRQSLRAAPATHDSHFLTDAADVLDQVISSLELAPQVEELSSTPRPVPTATDVARRVADRFRAHADLKGIRLDVDVQELDERFDDHEQLAEALAILMENALHYVPPSGQVVVGVRWMEHKGKPLLLFFVMDNGPVVPEALRQAIFEPSFVWNPASPERAGRGLFKCREFATAHSGSVWVESKTGKACTFFLRVRPDGVR